MATDADEMLEPPFRRRIRRRWQVMLVLALLLLVALVVVWAQRRPIARGFVDRELTRAGVPARYTIADIGLSSQRLTNVVIGDPAHPDLVADWVEVRTEVGLRGAQVTGISAGRVRMRARLVDGTISLGAIDRLMPPPSGKPFTLPKLDARLQDVRIRLEAPQGVVGLKLSGNGRLDDGFVGRLAAVAPRLDTGGCILARSATALSLRVSAARPSVEGPVRVGEARCGGVHVRSVAADVAATLGVALDRWTGRAQFAAARITGDGVVAQQLLGSASFDGTARSTVGDATAKLARVSADVASATAMTGGGRYRIGSGGFEFNGHAAAGRATLGRALLADVAALGTSGGGTPVAPLARRLAAAGVAAGRDFSGRAAIEAVVRGDARAIRVAQLDLSSVSGARATLAGSRLRFGAVETGGRLTLGGGGLPDVVADLRQGARGIDGTAVIQPYAADGARLALSRVTFTGAGGGDTRVMTTATMSGPLGDGRVDGLVMPVDAHWAGTRVAVNPRCVPLGWQRVAIAGLVLNPARIALCPVAGALLTVDRGRMGGGARIASPRLTGTLGGTPLTLAAAGSELRLADRGFTIGDVSARLGAPERLTRIDVATLTGRIDGAGVAGRFSGAAGQIGNVPLLLSDATGDWSLRNGVLALGGHLAVADAAPDPRFKPLASDDVALKLADGRITATGTLHTPKGNAKVADVALEHLLATGAGRARLDVPGIAFATGGLQPDDLTPITYGVIAEVVGTVSGRGDIAWDRDGVTSTGAFRTSGAELAAAFGPVTGLSGEIVFTDLLGLVSAPDQAVTIASVNPGISVENGTVRYQLIGDSRVAVTGGRWPFAGGELLLDSTTLDFDAAQQRRMTFRVVGVDAATFLQQFDFDNLNATGTFDGVLPMVFDASGGRIADGRLAARAGGSIAYIGTVTEKDVGTWGNFAFQALKALDYRSLDITMNGPLAGEMVTAIRFAGVSQGKGTRSNILIRRLAHLPLVFNVTVRAPFRQLIDSVQSYYDPSRLIRRNLPALIERQEQRPPPAKTGPTIQAGEREDMR